ncbi:bifunctional diaminohydroxyphosphoribosylaminopyrimidine deaminase/5-amino-6-(5-phosphoribosylamino)uracil reductase RibD [Stakelama marina]|uniref:Riboflavin biosynthesis protein RibD n=1 Tax=Stakelama marina TaxID=2826939 RepID=A0A8T4ILF4_9SPHN|nr:bifunctional diaminohydroxyphosphoribosylaminopyrimidine deaminase/5-amino-6-(5-phosphoribosylamino)uracil reductase RibD [Stakelama marina]MBR0553179.1 bifunctional diaminohydroxyphosphoribosylaminopyrimidine deaminase/5-amino-6-(5-phosphoribosylamino)uracil reductase RibD [Stakelama marina]
MGAALALAERGRGRTAPNPNVGCVIVKPASAQAGDRVVGRGWTQPGGRPHAEAMALEQAGDAARGSTAYVTLEPCAHMSPRGPACSTLLAEAGVERVVVALGDPDPRTDGSGIERLRAAGITVDVGIRAEDARRSMAGFLARQSFGRPHVTLKLATSLDGCIARADGESRWITGEAARAHAHLERARHDAILVGRGTFDADGPRLDVRLAGLENRSPRRILLSGSAREPDGWTVIDAPGRIGDLDAVDYLMVEGGAQTAAAFLRADLVDRLLLYRAPILIAAGMPALGDIGLDRIADAHGRWRGIDSRVLGSDRLDAYERIRD